MENTTATIDYFTDRDRDPIQRFWNSTDEEGTTLYELIDDISATHHQTMSRSGYDTDLMRYPEMATGLEIETSSNSSGFAVIRNGDSVDCDSQSDFSSWDWENACKILHSTLPQHDMVSERGINLPTAVAEGLNLPNYVNTTEPDPPTFQVDPIYPIPSASEQPIQAEQQRCNKQLGTPTKYPTQGQSSKSSSRQCDGPKKSPKRPVYQHVCTICNRSFKLKICLEIHLESHLLPFYCQICGKNYGQKMYLQRHFLTQRHIKKKERLSANRNTHSTQ